MVAVSFLSLLKWAHSLHIHKLFSTQILPLKMNKCSNILPLQKITLLYLYCWFFYPLRSFEVILH